MMADMTDRLRNVLETRIAACRNAGNETQAKKWEAELKALTTPAHVQALESINFDPAKLDDMAIYVAQKVRKLISNFLGAGRLDPYTQTLLTNALALQGQSLDGKALRAALTPNITTNVPLTQRREGSEGTASSQASSTRLALVALGAAVNGRSGLKVNFAHPIVAKVMGA